MSKVKRGTAGELIVKAKALLNAYNVFENTNQDSKTDLILEKDSKLYRIQVKILSPKGVLPLRKLTHSKTAHKQYHYTIYDIDYFAAVDLKTFDVYMVPFSVVENYTSSIIFWKLQPYKNNFNLQEPYSGNIISESPQVGETFGNGNAELADESRASVETLRETPKYIPTIEEVIKIINKYFDLEYSGYSMSMHGFASEVIRNLYGEDKVQTTK